MQLHVVIHHLHVHLDLGNPPVLPFPTKFSKHHQVVVQMTSSICHDRSPTIFAHIKAAVLQIAGSLWVDIDLGRTNPEDQDTPLNYGFNLVSSRVQLQKISCVASLFTFHHQTHCLMSIQFARTPSVPMYSIN